MISRASELLKIFIEEEKQKIDGVCMPHMPTLGDAFEEITKQAIDQEFVIPNQLNLRVVKGFIETAGQLQPQQIDCMLVDGEGRQYGITDNYIYDIGKVLCIFEVKKTLNKSALSDAIDHLGSIRKTFAQYFEEKLKSEKFEPGIAHARKSFAQITGKIAPTTYSGLHNLPKAEGILFYTLVQEQHAPVSIIHGYSGYQTESGLRRVFSSILEERISSNEKSIAIPSLPTLVTSNDFCLIKGNGHPYLALKAKMAFAAILSTRHNTARIMLEILWAKIAAYCNLKMPYGLDLEMETVAPLLIAEPCENADKAGWIYEVLDYKEKALERDEDAGWEPAKIGAAELCAVNFMAFGGGYLSLDNELDKYLIEHHSQTLDQTVQNLIQTTVFALEDNCVRPVALRTSVLPCDDGTGYVSNDRDRFDAWCAMESIEPTYFTILFVDSE